MITEIAILNIRTGEREKFEAAFAEAQTIIEAAQGYIQHELHKCIENDDRYLLTIRWETLEDHTIGFRQGPDFSKWKKLLHHFYDPFPVVEHYKRIF